MLKGLGGRGEGSSPMWPILRERGVGCLFKEQHGKFSIHPSGWFLKAIYYYSNYVCNSVNHLKFKSISLACQIYQQPSK